MTIPQWLQQHLTEIGRFNVDGISRKAKLRRCRRCGGHIIVGLDHDPCGIPTSADPTHLDQLAELLALATGRSTYDLALGPKLERRHRWNIRTPRRYPVLANHQCRDGVPLRIDDAVLQVFIPAIHHHSEEPPF